MENVIQSKIDSGELSLLHFSSLERDKQKEIAEYISSTSEGDGNLLEVHYKELSSRACFLVLLDEKNKFISCAGLMQPEANAFGMMMSEVGTMITVPEWRGKGCATYLLHQIDEWAANSNAVDGIYAFISEKSRDLVISSGYRAEVNYLGKRLNVADILPKTATDLCRTVCGHRDKIRLMDLSEKDSLSEAENAELLAGKFAREKKFEKEIVALEQKIAVEKDSEKIRTYEEVIWAYVQNLRNNLYCCDFAVAKLL
ncbi:MAG: hypothetical protein Q4A27_00425 [bacterium]|nr:hypothetical protein [bacterium]